MITVITPFKVIQFYLHRFCYHIKLVCNFLLISSTNLHPILHSFQVDDWSYY